MKKIILILIFAYLNSFAQDCPTRIGDFEINSTNLDDLKLILPLYTISSMSNIKNADDYQVYKVEHEELDDEYSGGYFAYEVKPDLENIKSWYNVEIANPNDSTRVFFIPSYKVDDVVIKNVLLKFYNNQLYFIRASLTKSYADIILEKYKGKGHKSEEKKTPNACKNVKFKRYPNIFSQYFFSSTENKIRAMLTFDFKINKYCETVINDRIEIFDFDIYIREGDKIIANLEKLKKEQEEKKKFEKEEKLKKF
ncbi:hypothetical protein LZZ90_09905 [Flavobacterium sp. SM15]|uniref:hypothetical protein n=1 Tax=Flavobacterium sp. SM15 TaxID=2908005 RepID=UPI001EDAABB5|nr:hypothetical protein [Flavobacterium sp. SM15]MCG2611817.1 hypothetical protein [Flavobacterium sp. SM15]